MDETKIFLHAGYTCPVCGWTCRSKEGGLAVSLENIKGTYCLECYGKWIDTNIPKMIETLSPNG